MIIHSIIASHLNEREGKSRLCLLRFAIQSILEAKPNYIYISISSDIHSVIELKDEMNELRERYFSHISEQLIIKIRAKSMSQFEHISQIVKKISTDKKNSKDNNEWILFCDDDDLVSPDILQIYKECIEFSPDLKVLFCDRIMGGYEEGLTVKVWDDIFKNNNVHTSIFRDHTGSFWNLKTLEECLSSKDFRKFHENNKAVADCFVRLWADAYTKHRQIHESLVYYRQYWKSYDLADNIHFKSF